MSIKNKFLRFLVSVFITLILYFSLAMILVQGDIDEVVEAMILVAVFGLFIVGPTLIFIVYLSYQLLTIKSERSKRLPNIFKALVGFIVFIILLYFLGMHTDLFDNLF